jgi:multidrug efflux pump subunit AcrA (membrane-fusion protein)
MAMIETTETSTSFAAETPEISTASATGVSTPDLAFLPPVAKRAARLVVAVGRGCVQIWRGNRILILICAASFVLGVGFLVVFIGPRYTDPTTWLHTSKFGYGTISRKLGRPFPVASRVTTKRVMLSRLHGEEILSSEPIQIPIIAMARIEKVHAATGDRVTKGQLLVELDVRRAAVKLEAANSALKTAVAEKERTVIGSSYIMANERPDKEKIHLLTAQRSTAIQEQLIAMEKELLARGSASRGEFLAKQLDLLLAINKLREAEWNFNTAESGRKLSIEIADTKIEEARLACKHREIEMDDYRVHAPCDGIVERCLVHAGEYNQDPGKPAFLVNRGLWFEARMDQTTAGRVLVCDPANVYLDAFPNQPLNGRVTRVAPLVSYDLGGPEATRPVRPLGSGAPEWPSTYAARVEFDAPPLPLMPGLTGFTRIDGNREVLAVPVEVLLARSGRSALVYVVEEGRYRPCKVVLGSVFEGWAEVRSGLDAGAEVLTDGHQVLEPGDRIALNSRDGQPVVPVAVLESGKQP